jgi:RHS repeat-associated protein
LPNKFDFKPQTPPFVTESSGTAYLLVELLNEKGEVINPEYKKYYVSSQDEFTKIGSADNEPIDFGDECQTSGFLRFSLVNENETQPAYFDDFEITHKPNPQKLTVSSWAEYYAFGKVAKASCAGAGSYRYGYQGEFAEKDGETDWNSFELRQYDSDIARWLSVDPMRQHHSPYLAMSNNPVSFIDPDGGKDGNWVQRAWNNIGNFLGLWGKSCGAGYGEGRPAEKFNISKEKQELSIDMAKIATQAGNSQTDNSVTFVDGYANLGKLFMQGTINLEDTVFTTPDDFMEKFKALSAITNRREDFTNTYFKTTGKQYIETWLPSSSLPFASKDAIAAYKKTMGGNFVPALQLAIVAISHRNTKVLPFHVHRNWLGMVKSIRVGARHYGNKSEFLQYVKTYTENITLQGQTHQGVEVSLTDK